MLLPLFIRLFRCEDRKEIGRVGTGMSVQYFLHDGFPWHGYFLSCRSFPVGQDASLDIVFGEVEYVVSGHAMCVHGEKEHVAGKSYLWAIAAQICIAQTFHFIKSQSVPLFLYPIAHIHAFERVLFCSQPVTDGQLVDAFEVADVE